MLLGVLMGSLFISQMIEGNPRAKVRVVIYEDLQCKDCATFRQMMDSYLLPRFGGQVAFEYKDFPLPKHDWARKAAMVSRHFETTRPEAGMHFRRYVLDRLTQINAEIFEERVREFARDNDLDPSDAVRALRSSSLDEAVENDYQEGIARGVSKTPTVYVENKPFIEKFKRADIVSAIEKALAQ